ncbi:MAG: amidoligase family protein [Nanoarchaeota archaeon]
MPRYAVGQRVELKTVSHHGISLSGKVGTIVQVYNGYDNRFIYHIQLNEILTPPSYCTTHSNCYRLRARAIKLHRENQNNGSIRTTSRNTYSKINFNDLVMGWEVECNKFKENVYDSQRYYWLEKKYDGSVIPGGHEFIQRRPNLYLESLKELWVFFKEFNPEVNKTCGLHMHYSIMHPLFDNLKTKNKFFNNLISIASIYEKRIFSLVPKSRRDNRYCLPISSALSRAQATKDNKLKDRQLLGDIHRDKYSNGQRYSWINFVELYRQGGHKTVEFRLLGNTVRYFYITGMSYLYAQMVLTAWNMIDFSPIEYAENIKEIERIICLLETVKEAYSGNIDYQDTIRSLVDYPNLKQWLEGISDPISVTTFSKPITIPLEQENLITESNQPTEAQARLDSLRLANRERVRRHRARVNGGN